MAGILAVDKKSKNRMGRDFTVNESGKFS